MKKRKTLICALPVALFAVLCLLAPQSFAETYDVGGVTIEVTIVPDKSEIILGEPIHISFIVQNHSDRDLYFYDGGDYRNRLGRSESYQVKAVRSDGKEVPVPRILVSLGGLMGSQQVPAHGNYTRHLFLPLWAPFEETGSYTITCQKDLNFKSLPDSVSVATQVSTHLEVKKANPDGMGKVISRLGEELISDNDEKANLAIQALDYIHDERVVPYLLRVIDPGNHDLTMNAIRSLAKFSSDQALEGIIRGMSVRPSEIRKAGNEATAIHFACEIRLQAADALKRCKHPRAFSLLLSMQNDSYWLVRLRVVQAIRDRKWLRGINIIEEMTRDENEDVREQAKECLQEFRNKGN